MGSILFLGFGTVEEDGWTGGRMAAKSRYSGASKREAEIWIHKAIGIGSDETIK
jgi:hypothetical protein